MAAPKVLKVQPEASPQVDTDTAWMQKVLDKPNKKLKPDVFLKVIAVYPERDACYCYVYRRYPRIDRKLKDPKAPLYIEKHEGPLTIEHLLHTWGSGEYKLAWTDDGQPRGKTRICETVVDVYDAEHPPVIDLEELMLEEPANKSFVRGLHMRGEIHSNERGGNPDGSSSSEFASLAREVIQQGLDRAGKAGPDVQDRILDLYADASKQAVKLAAEGSKPVDILDQVTKLKGLMGDDTALLKILMDSQAKNQQLMIDILRESRDSKGSGGLLTELDGLEKVAALLDRFGNRGGGTSWASEIPNILTGLAQLLVAFGTARQGQVGAPASSPGAAESSSAMRPEHPQPAGIMAPAATGGETLSELELAEIGRKALEAMSQGWSGDAFAESICVWMGEEKYEQVLALGESAISSLVAPFVGVEAKPTVDEFIRAFFAFNEEKDNSAESPATGAAPPAGPPASPGQKAAEQGAV